MTRTARSADADVPREHRVRGRERRSQDERRTGREPRRERAEGGDAHDGERHRDAEQPEDRRPAGEAQLPVELQPGGEERHDDRELREAKHELRVVHGIDPAQVEELDDNGGAKPEGEVDEGGGESAVALVREGADRRSDRDAQEDERDGVELRRGEAGPCGEE